MIKLKRVWLGGVMRSCIVIVVGKFVWNFERNVLMNFYVKIVEFKLEVK